MAARKVTTSHAPHIRDQIKVPQLIRRLQYHALEEPDENKRPVNMSRTQVMAALALIKKVLPDVTEVTNQVEGEIVIRWQGDKK